jgi:restriction system protein
VNTQFALFPLQVNAVLADVSAMGRLFASSTSTTLFNDGSVLHHAFSQATKDLFTEFIITIWPVWTVIGAVALVGLGLRLRQLRRLARSGIADIDRMDGRTFEEYLGLLFGRLGYRAEVTPSTGDYGADLVVARDGVRQVVQAKRWNRPVGVTAVQQVVAARSYYHCQGALVVTNRGFTASARRLARANGVKLWDRQDLVERMLAVQRQAKAQRRQPGRVAPARAAVEGIAPSPPLAWLPAVPGSQATLGPVGNRACCATCGAAVSERVRDYCAAQASRFGGQIYCFKHQRSARPASP